MSSGDCRAEARRRVNGKSLYSSSMTCWKPSWHQMTLFALAFLSTLASPPHNVPPSPEIRLPRPYYTLISRGYVEGVGLLAMILEAFVFLEAFFFSQYEGVGKEVQKNGRVRSWYDIPLGDKGCFRPWKLEASSSLAEIISLDQMDHPNKTK